MAEPIKKMCPHCASTMFAAEITRGCVVEMYSDVAEGTPNHKVLKESNGNYEIEIVKCVRCKHELKEEDLVVGVPCKECGKVVAPSDINEDGLCDVCSAVKQRTELATASREDLIRMLLDAEKKANPVAAQVAKQVEKAEEVAQATTAPVDSTDDTATETVADDGQAAAGTTEKKPRRRATRKKDDAEATTEATEETVAEVEEAPAEQPVPQGQDEAVADIAGQQEAPFPDVELPQEEQQTQQVATPAPDNGGFQMFPDDEDRF